MRGIDLNGAAQYRSASFRYFSEGEYHVTRVCTTDVLVLVFEGALCFTEGDVSCRVGAGEYYIQRKGLHQGADRPSESPKYLYIHFDGVWGETEPLLPYRGTFSPERLMPLMKRLDRTAHSHGTRAEENALFYQILSELYRPPMPSGVGEEIANFLEEHALERVSLEDLSKRFGYSKNQIINVMKRTYGESPLEYQHRRRLSRAEWLLRVTSTPLALVAEECGYGDYSQFYKEFCRAYGRSPKQWRCEQTREFE